MSENQKIFFFAEKDALDMAKIGMRFVFFKML